MRMTRNAFVSPEILVEANRLVIDDPTTLVGPQSIPFDLVQSVHIGPEVALQPPECNDDRSGNAIIAFDPREGAGMTLDQFASTVDTVLGDHPA